MFDLRNRSLYAGPSKRIPATEAEANGTLWYGVYTPHSWGPLWRGWFQSAQEALDCARAVDSKEWVEIHGTVAGWGFAECCLWSRSAGRPECFHSYA